MTTYRYIFSLTLLLSIFQLNAQYSIIYPQNPDIPYFHAYTSDGTNYAVGRGIDGDYYYTNWASEFGGYQEDSYFIGAYSGDFKVTAGQKYNRMAVVQLNGQTLQIDRIMPDGTVEESATYDFPSTSSITFTDVFSSQYYYDRSIYVSGLETNAANEKVIFTIKFDEFLEEVWREDMAVDDSVEAVEIVDNYWKQWGDGILLAYVRPADFSLQVAYVDYEGTLIWADEVMNSAAEGSVPSLNHSYLATDQAYLYGSYETMDGDTTVYFAYNFHSETNEQYLQKETRYVPGSTDDDGAYKIQALYTSLGGHLTYVEAGTSYKNDPNGRLYISKKTFDGHIEWYKEYDFLAEVSFVHVYGYMAGSVDGEGWFAYFNPDGNLRKHQSECASTTNLATNACITMSSQALGGAANQAVDGLTSENAAANFAATTTEEYRPWMMLDLGEIYLVDSIRIHPSNDTTKLFTNTRLYGDLHPIPADVTRAHMTIEWQTAYYNVPTTEPFTIVSSNWNPALNVPARYFSLHKLGYGTLEIEEIEIFGCPVSNCEDNDGDGFCFTEDCNDFDPIVPALPGTPCDDGNPLTDNDVVLQDHCTCLGKSNDIDFDNDGLSLAEDCNDYYSGSYSCYNRLDYLGATNYGELDPNTCECFTEINPIGCNLSYRVEGSTLTIYGVKADGQTGLNLFDANWQIIYNCNSNNCNESVLEITDLPDGQYYLNAQIFSITDCDLEATITIDQNACNDLDGDGVCAIDDPDPTNGNIPAAPGTPCNDCNADTNNDVIQADGFTCSGTLLPCDDADNDNVCADDDCDDNNPNVPAALGTPCDDNDPNTENDSIQADGCTCLGEVPPPCVDVDEDGICEVDDCDDNNPNIPTAPGTTCDDGDANTENDVIQADGCTCMGTFIMSGNLTINCPADIIYDPVPGNLITLDWPLPTGETDCANGGFTINQIGGPALGSQILADNATYEITHVATDNCGNSTQCSFNVTEQFFTADIAFSFCPTDITVPATSPDGAIVTWQEPEITTNCPDGASIFGPFGGINANGSLVPVGTNQVEYIGIGVGVGNGCGVETVCNFSVTVTPFDCPDMDEDGVCAADDCDDNNPNLPTTPGTPCSDGDPNTSDDVILADGCTCAGMLIIATDDDNNQAFMGGNTSGNQAEVVENLVKTKVSNQIKLLPNPVNNRLTILFNANENQEEEIIIYNSNGQRQLRIFQKALIGINSVKIDVSDLPSGVYFVRLKQLGKVERLVKL